MVQVVMGFLEEAPSMEVKLQTIETLRTVTEGKVWLCETVECMEAELMQHLDFRRGGKGSRDQDPVKHQEGARKQESCSRHSV